MHEGEESSRYENRNVPLSLTHVTECSPNKRRREKRIKEKEEKYEEGKVEENYGKGNNLFLTSPGLSIEFSTSSTSTKHYQKCFKSFRQLPTKLVFKHVKSST